MWLLARSQSACARFSVFMWICASIAVAPKELYTHERRTKRLARSHTCGCWLARTLAQAHISLYTQRDTQTALVRKKETRTIKKGQWRGTHAKANIEMSINITRPCVQGGRGGGNGGRGGGPQNHSQMTHRGGEHDVDPSVYLCTACLIFMSMRL